MNCINGTGINDIEYLPHHVPILRSSERVERLNKRQITNHEKALTEYHSKIKCINEEVEMHIREVMTEMLKKVNDCLCSICDVKIRNVAQQKNFLSVQQFHDIWQGIKNDINETINDITEVDDYIINVIEAKRSAKMNSVTTLYFDEIKSYGIWDDIKLNKFLNAELESFNQEMVKNVKRYSVAKSSLKVFVVSKMVEFREHWEKHMLSWRDFLVDKGLTEVKKIVKDAEDKRSKQMEQWRAEVFSKLNKDDEVILEIYGIIIKGIPYNQEKMIALVNKVEDILREKENEKMKFIEKTRFYNSSVIEEFEKKLVIMKQFLLEEASCSESQYIKTFSKYTGDGTESFELIGKQILISDASNLDKNLKTMNYVHSIIMRFLHCIFEVWCENAEEVEKSRNTLFDELKAAREEHEAEKRILEYAIDKHTKKISCMPCPMKLDKLLEKVELKLDAIDENSQNLHSRLMHLIISYPETCRKQISHYEENVLSQIGLELVFDKVESGSGRESNQTDVTDSHLASNESQEPDGFVENNNRNEELNRNDAYRKHSISANSQPFIRGDSSESLLVYQHSHGPDQNGTIEQCMVTDYAKIPESCIVSNEGQIYKRLSEVPALAYNPGINDVLNDVKDICEKLYIDACKVIIDHIANNEKNHIETSDALFLKLRNEIDAERTLRNDIHAPRLALIQGDFEKRKAELDQFKVGFDQIYETSVDFESKLVRIEEEFSDETGVLLNHFEAVIDKVQAKQLKTRKSQMLMRDQLKFESQFIDIENKIPELMKHSLAKADNDFKVMLAHEEKFFNYASNGCFDFSDRSKFHHEFSEIKERVKSALAQCKRTLKQIESSKIKKLSTLYQGHKTYYKHCLLGLFFVEQKSLHLANIRTKIRSVASYGEKDLFMTKKLLKNLETLSTELDKCRADKLNTQVSDLKDEFIRIFVQLKNFINFLNYRCSDIVLPAQDSFAKLNDKYFNFVDENASITETIEFTRDIMNMTSQKECLLPVHADVVDSTEQNWVVDRSIVEKKFITGNISCIYGVGANCFDVPNHPWASACSTLVSNNSYWLGKSRDGMQALKDIQERKQATALSASPNNSNTTLAKQNSGNRMKELSDKIRKLVIAQPGSKAAEAAPLDVSSQNTDNFQGSLSKQPFNSFNTDGGRDQKIPILPAIKTNLRSTVRNDSVNQMNMKKVLNLNKTVEYLTKETNRKRKSSYFQKNNKLIVYDFLIMDEEELRSFVFDTAKFFSIPVRKYNIDDMCASIFSVIEKVKCYLLHLQEDFIVSCIIFYRQKHLSIKYRELMHANYDQEIDDFVSKLQGYLEAVHKDCEANIKKVKGMLEKLYIVFESSSSRIYQNISYDSKRSFTNFYEEQIRIYKDTVKDNRVLKEKLLRSLKPSYSHPNHVGTLKKVCDEEILLRANEKLVTLFDYMMGVLNERLRQFEADVKQITDNLLEIIRNVIQIKDIRKITSSPESTFEVKKIVFSNLMSTMNQVRSSLPLDDDSSMKNKTKSTKERLMLAVMKDRNTILSEFRYLHKTKSDELKELHSFSCTEEDNWVEMWQSTIKNLRQLVDHEL